MVHKYYQKHKDRLQKEAHKRYKNCSQEEKDKKHKKLYKDIKFLLKRIKKKKVSVISGT